VDVINLTKLILEYASDKIWMIDSGWKLFKIVFI
jgi:hypothetical protein